MDGKSRSVAFALACLVFLAGIAVKASKAERKMATDCPKFIVIGSRGSGAKPGTPGWGGGLGTPGERFALTFQRLVGAKVSIEYNPYPAVGIMPSLKKILAVALKGPNPYAPSALQDSIVSAFNGGGAFMHIKQVGAYGNSVEEGEKALESIVEQHAEAPCGRRGTKMILVGYSQGAEVTADTFQLRLMPSAKFENGGLTLISPAVYAVVLFGDPYYDQNDYHADVWRRDNEGILGSRSVFDYSYSDDPETRVLSYCHAHDPVCQGVTQLIHGWGAHTNYEQDAENAGYFLARLANKCLRSGRC